MRGVLVRLVVVCSLAAFASACSTADETRRIDPVGPTKTDFNFVVAALDYRCGSLDCHGSAFRNLRVYGFGALRLDPSHTPAAPPDATPPEIDATYDAVVGLEPELTRRVVDDKGARPARLTLVRKARGEEAHKGGIRIVKGDDADKCLLSWLQGTVDVESCKRVPLQF